MCVARKQSSSLLFSNDEGQIGSDDAGTDALAPFQITLPAGTVSKIMASGNFTCAVVDDELYCWGDNVSGQLGAGDTTQLDAPGNAVTFPGSEAPDKLAMGDLHTCAITDAGSLYCWGEGDDGRLGRGDEDDQYEPTLVAPFVSDPAGDNRSIEVAAGTDHTCVVMQMTPDDEPQGQYTFCFGSGIDGALGSGNAFSVGDDEPGFIDPTWVNALRRISVWQQYFD